MGADNKVHNEAGLPFKPRFLKAAILPPLLASSAVVGMSFIQLSYAQETAETESENSASENGAENADLGTLEEIVVEGKVYFRHKEAFSGTKMNMLLKDIPQSVKVITGDVMDTANMKSFEDVYKVDASGSTSHATDSFPRNYYRGFHQQGNNAVKVDGFRMGANIDLDLATFERFEIVKGPVSTLYGQTSVAGTLNAVSKVPESEFGMNVLAEVESNDYYRSELDVTGPLTDDGRLSYRLISAYEDSDSFIDFAQYRLKLLAPSISYKIGDNTDILARVNYQEHTDVYHWGTPVKLVSDDPFDGVEIADIPRSRFFGMPWNNATKDALFVQFIGSHHFDNGWTLKGSYQYSETTETTFAFATESFDANGDSTYMSIYADESEGELFAGEVNLFGDIEAFGRQHTLFVGLDYSKQKDTFLSGFSLLDELDSPYNVFRPDYSLVEPALNLDDYNTVYDSREEQVDIGATVQLQLRPTDSLSVLLGVRYSISELLEEERVGESLAQARALPFTVFIDEKLENTSFQLGVTYAITEDINFYATYGESFEPSTDREFVEGDPIGRMIDPEEGTSIELGFKGDIGEDLSFAVAAFEMERTNISQTDRAHRQFDLPIGTQRGRGIELDFSGEVLSGWNVLGSLAVMDAEYTKGAFKGLQSSFAPKFAVSLYTDYQFQSGLLEGLSIGGGVVHKAGRKVFDAESFQDAEEDPSVPAYKLDFGDFTEVDVDVTYEWESWTLSVGATNLLNEKYYSAAFDALDFGVNVNPSRHVYGTIEYDF